MIKEILENINEAVPSVVIRKFDGTGNPKYKNVPGYLHFAIFIDKKRGDFYDAFDMDIGEEANIDDEGIKDESTAVDYNSSEVKAFIKYMEEEFGKIKLVKDKF